MEHLILVSYVNTPTHKLDIKLNNILRSVTKFHYSNTVKNLLKLSNFWTELSVPTSVKFVPLWLFTTMFSNISKDECIEIIKELLIE